MKWAVALLSAALLASCSHQKHHSRFPASNRIENIRGEYRLLDNVTRNCPYELEIIWSQGNPDTNALISIFRGGDQLNERIDLGQINQGPRRGELIEAIETPDRGNNRLSFEHSRTMTEETFKQDLYTYKFELELRKAKDINDNSFKGKLLETKSILNSIDLKDSNRLTILREETEKVHTPINGKKTKNIFHCKYIKN